MAESRLHSISRQSLDLTDLGTKRFRFPLCRCALIAIFIEQRRRVRASPSLSFSGNFPAESQRVRLLWCSRPLTDVWNVSNLSPGGPVVD